MGGVCSIISSPELVAQASSDNFHFPPFKISGKIKVESCVRSSLSEDDDLFAFSHREDPANSFPRSGL